jgi:hypothetical protein
MKKRYENGVEWDQALMQYKKLNPDLKIESKPMGLSGFGGKADVKFKDATGRTIKRFCGAGDGYRGYYFSE